MSGTQQVQQRPPYAPGWLVGQLPVGMRDDDMLVRFTTIFERLGETLRSGADAVEHVADLTVTSSDMLVYLQRWLGYELLDPELPLVRQREIVAAVGRSLPVRGTAVALRTILEAVTQGPVQIDEPGCVLAEDDPAPAPAAVVVTVRSTGHLREHELQALVRDEVPAHLPVHLVVTGAEGAS